MTVYVNKTASAKVEMTLTGVGYVYTVEKITFPCNEVIAFEMVSYDEAKRICDNVEGSI